MSYDITLILKKKLDKTSPIPLYVQIERAFQEMIEDGTLSPDERFPNEKLIGEELGLNHLTIRKALSPLVKKGLITRVKKSGTFVNKKLVTPSQTIGFFYFAEAKVVMASRAESIQRYLARCGYDLKIIAFDEDFYDRINLWKEIQSKQLSGAIFTALGSENCKRQLRELERRGFPHVRMGNKYFAEDLTAPLVRGNDKKRTTDSLIRLWNLGHRNIGLVVYRAGWETDEAYFDFYRDKEFEKRWLMVLDFWGPPEQYRRIPGPQLARGYLEGNRDITAVLVDHKLFCEDVVEQARLMGKGVPEDFSVICLNEWVNLEFGEASAMWLSPRSEGEKACEVLLKVLRGEWKSEDRLVLVDYEFIERESVAPVKAVTVTV